MIVQILSCLAHNSRKSRNIRIIVISSRNLRHESVVLQETIPLYLTFSHFGFLNSFTPSCDKDTSAVIVHPDGTKIFRCALRKILISKPLPLGSLPYHSLGFPRISRVAARLQYRQTPIMLSCFPLELINMQQIKQKISETDVMQWQYITILPSSEILILTRVEDVT